MKYYAILPIGQRACYKWAVARIIDSPRMRFAVRPSLSASGKRVKRKKTPLFAQRGVGGEFTHDTDIALCVEAYILRLRVSITLS